MATLQLTTQDLEIGIRLLMKYLEEHYPNRRFIISPWGIEIYDIANDKRIEYCDYAEHLTMWMADNEAGNSDDL